MAGAAVLVLFGHGVDGTQRCGRDLSATRETLDAWTPIVTTRPGGPSPCCRASRAASQWTGPELAARLGVTTRTLRRDVERLRGLGYDVVATPGTAGGYRLLAGATVPPLFLDADEAVAVVTALLAASGDQTTGMVDASLRALSKLHHVLPVAVRTASRRGASRGPHTRRSAAPRPSIPQHIAVLAESCRDAAAVRFDYRARDGTPSRRRVEPNALVTVRSVWYLIGFDLDRDDWRMFRVDRITGDVERTGHGAARRTVPGGDPLAYVGRSLADMPHAHHADVDLAVPGPTALAANAWLNPRRVEADGTAPLPDPPGDRRPRRAHPPGDRSPRRRPRRADRGRGRRARAPRRRRQRARQQLIDA